LEYRKKDKLESFEKDSLTVHFFLILLIYYKKVSKILFIK